jgi:hypothetical protein
LSNHVFNLLLTVHFVFLSLKIDLTLFDII